MFCFQRGHGLGSLISKFALPALKKLTPIVTRQVKKHGKSVAKEIGRAAIKSMKSKNKKKSLETELYNVIERKLVTQKKKKKKKKKPMRRDIFTKL